ncbi:unnamed protein product [Parascedosporium putredinis]|uniref:Uncharacterized protein n=1 Tax=Parascedosporium putredinis TaxID=1442378 RepID=A0A9P1MCK1_9PEZI|nr:unnamed protein product [Parascedosporium putredinis]CAI8000840.1 unnamed protein product [Parascedosporium putredinis]
MTSQGHDYKQAFIKKWAKTALRPSPPLKINEAMHDPLYRDWEPIEVFQDTGSSTMYQEDPEEDVSAIVTPH